jgi:hypothetical protein
MPVMPRYSLRLKSAQFVNSEFEQLLGENMNTRTVAETFASKHPDKMACLSIIVPVESGAGKWRGVNKYFVVTGAVQEVNIGKERRPNYPIVVIDPRGRYYEGVDGGFTLGSEGEPVVGGIPIQAAGTI